tara:strand:- start:183 stop:533 length:351 start_codon:yes stop_codon:yes gene_type:complete
MNHKPYNGWHNYETWCFNVWYGADPFDQFIEDMLKNYERKEGEVLTDRQRHCITLMHHLEEWMEELHDDQLAETNGFLADILGAGLKEICWYELAESFYDTHHENYYDQYFHDDRS